MTEKREPLTGMKIWNTKEDVKLKYKPEVLEDSFSTSSRVILGDDYVTIDFADLIGPRSDIVARVTMTMGHVESLRDILTSALKEYNKKDEEK